MLFTFHCSALLNTLNSFAASLSGNIYWCCILFWCLLIQKHVWLPCSFLYWWTACFCHPGTFLLCEEYLVVFGCIKTLSVVIHGYFSNYWFFLFCKLSIWYWCSLVKLLMNNYVFLSNVTSMKESRGTTVEAVAMWQEDFKFSGIGLLQMHAKAAYYRPI